MDGLSNEEIQQNLEAQGVTSVYRIQQRENGKYVPTLTLFLTFDRVELPQRIKAGYEAIEVRPYIPYPLRCYKSQCFGHTKISAMDMCPYNPPESCAEDEADKCIYKTLEKLYRHTVSDLEKRDDMEFFTPQYKLMFAEMEKFFKKSKNLRASNQYLQSELASTKAELQVIQKLSAIDKEMIEQLKEEMDKKSNKKLESLADDEETKLSKGLLEQISMLSLLVSEKEGVIVELQDVLDTFSKIKDSANEDRQLLLQENENFKQQLVNITKAKETVEEQYLKAEEKLKELNENLQIIDAELLTERNEKVQLRNEIVNMALEINTINEKCQKLEQELEAKSTDIINLKNENNDKLCAEFERVNAAINNITEQRNKKEEEIEKLKELLDKTSSDVKHLEETVKTLQEMNSQLKHEKNELATMLQQYEMKSSVELECDHFIQIIDAELLTERKEKAQLRNEIVNMALEINTINEKCQKLEQELEAKSIDTINLKNENNDKLCVEFERVDAVINEITEQRNKKEEEIEKLKELLDKTSSDVKHLEETVKTLQEMNSQLTHEKNELATMLQQYEMKRSVELECDQFIQEEAIEKRDLSEVFCTKSIFDKLTEECEKRNLKTKESCRQLKQYSGTLREVIEGLEEQLAQL